MEFTFISNIQPATIALTVVIVLVVFVISFWLIIKPPKAPIINLGKNETIEHCCITGGSSGIGLEIAKAVAKNGTNVTILARNVRKLKAAKKTILAEGGGGKVNVISLDLAVSDEKGYNVVSGAVDKIVEEFGAPTMLFNCAGTSLAKPIEVRAGAKRGWSGVRLERSAVV
jgi:hypothetical protein